MTVLRCVCAHELQVDGKPPRGTACPVCGADLARVWDRRRQSVRYQATQGRDMRGEERQWRYEDAAMIASLRVRP